MNEKNTSLIYKQIHKGKVVDSRIIKIKQKSLIVELAIVTVISRHTIQVGDKLSGRFGNKGVIANIVPKQDMPFDAETGETIDIILSPESVPSRRNMGLLSELMLGRLAQLRSERENKKYSFVSEPFNGFKLEEIKELLLEESKYDKTPQSSELSKISKRILRNGQTGEKFERPITCGNSY